MLKLKSISKIHRTTEVETRALNAVSLDVADGEFLAVMAPLTGLSKAGTAVVMVTHSPVYAAIARRAVKLPDGRVVAETLLAA